MIDPQQLTAIASGAPELVLEIITLGLTDLYQTLKAHQQKCRDRQELGEIIAPLTDLLESSVAQARQHLEKQAD